MREIKNYTPNVSFIMGNYGFKISDNFTPLWRLNTRVIKIKKIILKIFLRIIVSRNNDRLSPHLLLQGVINETHKNKI